MRLVWIGLALVATLSSASVEPARAQGAPSIVNPPEAVDRGARSPATLVPSQIPLSGVLDPEVYRLGPGDVLVANVWGKISMNLPLEVGPDGAVFVPGHGSIDVSGMTLAGARRRIESLLHAQYRGVRVEVRLQRVRSFYVYRTGEIRHPGPVLAQGSSRVVDLLPDSLFLPGSSRRNIQVRHQDGTSHVYDLELFMSAGVPQPSDALGGGDVIYVPRAAGRIGAWGGVRRPGSHETNPTDSLSTLFRLAGGLRPEAFGERALLIRWSEAGRESMWVSMDSVQAGTTNFPLRNGDNLYVPFDPEYREVHQVTVIGRVQRSGDYPIRLGESRISDVVEAAGGFLDDADLTAIRLIRRRNGTGEDAELDRLSRLSRDQMTESEYVSLQTKLAALSPDYRIEWARVARGDAALDPLLFDGDVIRVERSTNTIRVDGQVRRPGVFEFQPGRGSGHYVRLAGGYTDRAARSRVRVTRAVNGQSVHERDVEELAPGDFVWVPERPDQSTWDQVRDLITVAAQVATIVIAVRR